MSKFLPKHAFESPIPSNLKIPLSPSPPLPSMASIYSCKDCDSNLNLKPSDLFPNHAQFDAGNKNTLSFSHVDSSKLRFDKEDRIRPFFETLNYWGIHRARTRIRCNACGCLLGHVYDDGPPLMEGNGQLGFGPSQVVPRICRFRFRVKALVVRSES